MNFGKTAIRAALLGAAAMAFTTIAAPGLSPVMAASSVAAVVNKTAITDGDVQRRANFLKLQRRKGNLRKIAAEQLVDEVLKREEIAKRGLSVSTDEVDKAFARFAGNNKMSTAQLGQLLQQAGVGVDHFKAYIAVSMSWPRLVNARYGGGSRMSNEELVKRMNENGGQKPVTTEYFLQSVIFVIPEKKRGAITGKRKAEAEKSRASFPGCEQAKQFAANYKDVSIKNIGRVMAPELPEDWKPFIEKAKGMTTGTRVTEKGVEYLAICKQRQVNDDVAAEMVFRAEDLGKEKDGGMSANEQKYLDELRKKAMISYE